MNNVYKHLEYTCAIADVPIDSQRCIGNVIDRTRGPSNCRQRQCSRRSQSSSYCWQHDRSPHTREYVPLGPFLTFQARIRETLADELVRIFKRNNIINNIDRFDEEQHAALRDIGQMKISQDIDKILSVIFTDNTDHISQLASFLVDSVHPRKGRKNN